jgi:hypothetical protein
MTPATDAYLNLDRCSVHVDDDCRTIGGADDNRPLTGFYWFIANLSAWVGTPQLSAILVRPTGVSSLLRANVICSALSARSPSANASWRDRNVVDDRVTSVAEAT